MTVESIANARKERKKGLKTIYVLISANVFASRVLRVPVKSVFDVKRVRKLLNSEANNSNCVMYLSNRWLKAALSLQCDMKCEYLHFLNRRNVTGI